MKQQVAAEPPSPDLHQKLAATHAEHEEWMLCLWEVVVIERAFGQSPDTQYLCGLAYAGLKRREKALAAFYASLFLRPDHTAALSARGKVKMEIGDFHGAVGDFHRSSELDSATGSLLNLANAWRAAGNDREALRALEQGIKSGGPHPELLDMALEMDVKAGEWDAALKRVDSLQALAPRPEPWMVRRAKLLARAGRPEQADAAWRDLRDHLHGLPVLERGTPLLSSLLNETRAALGEKIPAPATAPPASLPQVEQVSITGLLTENFDSMGTGSAPPDGWSVIGQILGDNDAWITGIPAAGNPSAASAGVENNVLIVNSDAGGGGVGSSGGQAYNLALAGSDSRS